MTTNCIINIVLCCGVPSSGKSYLLKNTLAKNIFSSEYKICILSFDDYFKDAFHNDFSKFKISREGFNTYLLSEITNLSLEETEKNKKIIVFIEDNFPLRSNRKYVFKHLLYHLNKDFSFVELILNTSLEKCFEYNSKKNTPIPIEIIQSMFMQFESKPLYDTFDYIIINDYENSFISTELMEEIILKLAFNYKIIKAKINDTYQQKEYIFNMRGFILEKTDLLMKKIIHEKITKLKDNQEKQLVAFALSKIKKDYYITVKDKLDNKYYDFLLKDNYQDDEVKEKEEKLTTIENAIMKDFDNLINIIN